MDWEIVTINDCCDVLDNRRIPLNSEHRAKIPGNIPYYGANGVQGYISEYIFNEDLILVAEDGGNFEQFATRPIAYKISGKSWINNHAHILRAKSNYDQNFIYYSIVHKNILYFIQGGTRSKLNQSDLKSIKLQIPSSKIEQHTIATILDRIDIVIEKTSQLIIKYERIKTGLMQDLLKCGIDENGIIRNPETHNFKESPLGKIPVEWKVAELGQQTSITRLAGYEYSTLWHPVRDGEIIALRGFNIGENEIIERDFERISEKLSNRLYRSKLFKGDIVFPCVGTIGNAVTIREDNRYHINQNMAKITPKNEIISDFITYYLMSDKSQKEIERFNATTSQPNVLVGSLRKFLISFPTNKMEQDTITSLLRTANNQIKDQKSCLIKLQNLKKGLMQDLLTGQVRVEALMKQTSELV